MIDFQNPEYLRLKSAPNSFDSMLEPLLVNDEVIVATYKTVRDGIIFTNKRIFIVSVQGVTGKKKDITSLPYSKIQAFSTESAGVLDLESELQLWFSGIGKIRLEFSSGSNILEIFKTISTYIL